MTRPTICPPCHPVNEPVLVTGGLEDGGLGLGRIRLWIDTVYDGMEYFVIVFGFNEFHILLGQTS